MIIAIETPIAQAETFPPRETSRGLSWVARQALRIVAENWRQGSLDITLPNGLRFAFHGQEPGPAAAMVVRNLRLFRRVLRGADIGFARSFIEGDWESPDLAAVLIAFSANFDGLQRLVTGNPLVSAFNFLAHRFNRNTRSGARRNILSHYDLGNNFYSAWLDGGMTYSSAMFEGGANTLEAAQNAKYAQLAQKLRLAPGMKLLEIGCGWGGFAEYAAKTHGVTVTGLTISRAQAEYARARLQAEGLSDRVSIALRDYRDQTGRFDRIASIEMFEAVGEEYWTAYFQKARSLLAPDGALGLQTITIRDDLFKDYRARPDFIRRYVFPGGMLPSPSALMSQMRRAGLAVEGVHGFGEHYARTLGLWRERFDEAWRGIAQMGFDERFRRLWRFYLSYCEAGFATGRTDVVQVAARPA
jgi:cyclopropane-fatty-acyl-phospholipid synthase